MNMKIYTFFGNLDRLKVYIRGHEGTPYANEWWYLYVTFPEHYPEKPPIFRFITITYHLNVSAEGKICLNVIEKGYISSKHIVDNLQEIQELFLIPGPDTPVQIDSYMIFLQTPERYLRMK